MSYTADIDEFRAAAQARQLRYYAKRFAGAYKAAQQARQNAGRDALGYMEERVSPWDCAELGVILERAADELESGQTRAVRGRWWGFLGLHPGVIAGFTAVFVVASIAGQALMAFTTGRGVIDWDWIVATGLGVAIGMVGAARQIARGSKVHR